MTRCCTLRSLKERARQIMAQASSKEEEADRYRSIREARYLRFFTDTAGAFRFEGKVNSDVGARFLSSIEEEANALFDESRRSQEVLPLQAYRADALVNLVCGDARTGPQAIDSTPTDESDGTDLPAPGTRRGTKTPTRTDTVVIRVDAESLRRGWTESGECCFIKGVGPVPVAAVRELLPDAWIKIVVKDGVDVLNVCHVGRTVTAHMETALEERDPVCVVPGCDITHGLERHHLFEGFAVSGTTSLAELARVCRRHHDMITYDGFVLAGHPGAWVFQGPEPIDPEQLDSG